MTKYLISFRDEAVDYRDEDALMWAGKCASACRATVQVRELLPGVEAV